MKISTNCVFLERTQICFLLVFVLLNLGLQLLSVDSRPYPEGPLLSPTYLAAADGQRYWAVAISLVEQSTFTIPPLWDVRLETPLTRSGPLTPIFYAIPIKLFGLADAAAPIVILQCILLYILGWQTRTIAQLFGVNQSLLQGLVIFNPNLVSLAHFAQSDLLFSFFFGLLTFQIIHFLANPPTYPTRSYLLIGVLAGFSCMTRDIGIAITALLPVIVFISILRSHRRADLRYGRMLAGLLIACLGFALTVTPWSLRNYHVFGELSPTIGSSAQLNYNVLQLIQYETGKSSAEAAAIIDLSLHRYLSEADRNQCAFEKIESPYCRWVNQKAYLSMIFDRPFLSVVSAGLSASIKTLLSGGGSRIANYLGYTESDVNHMRRGITNYNFKRASQSLTHVLENNLVLFLILLLPTAFAILTRLLGLVGLASQNRRTRIEVQHIHFFLVLLVFCFLSLYFLVSTGRFRAPFEPILMLYAVIGIHQLSRFFRRHHC